MLRDQFYPGWKVLIDGREHPLLRANLINRAVFVPAGEHEVVFQYRPESLTAGYELASGGFLAFIIVSGIVYLSIAFYLARYRSILIFLSIFSVIQSAIQYGAILFFYPDVDRKRLQFFTLLAFCLSVCVHAGSLYILDHAPNGPRKTVLRLAEDLIEKNKR